jgi:transcriptional regulator with XRE-family HTH domain
MVKITDVARHAGVSPSTVSYALSGKRPISEETRRRIEASIRKLPTLLPPRLTERASTAPRDAP